jgi:hypothetical protein
MLKGVYLTLLMGPILPVPVPQPVTDALMSAQITVSAGQKSGFQLTFALSKQGIIQRTLLPAGLFDPKIRVILIATVNGFPNVLIDGIIARQEVTPSNEPGQSLLSITGEDLTLLMDLKDASGTPFPALPDFAIVNVLVAKYALYGMIPLVIPPLFDQPTLPIDKIMSEKGTDLNHINTLAEKAGYVFYLIPGPVPGTSTAYFGPEIRIGVPQPALNINMDNLTNVESLTFSFDGTSSESLAIMIQEPLTKLNIPIPIPDISLLKPPLAVKQAPTLKFRPLKGVANLSPVEAISKGLAEASKSADAVTGSGSLDVLRYGRVLQARQLVGVRGAGLTYDGLYYVKSVTHSIKRGEYKQSFTLARNGLISITPKVVP